MSKKYYTFTLHYRSALTKSEMREIATKLSTVAIERRMGFTVEEVCSERRLTYEEIWGED